MLAPTALETLEVLGFERYELVHMHCWLTTDCHDYALASRYLLLNLTKPNKPKPTTAFELDPSIVEIPVPVNMGVSENWGYLILREGNPVGPRMAVLRLPKPLLCPMILARRPV